MLEWWKNLVISGAFLGAEACYLCQGENKVTGIVQGLIAIIYYASIPLIWLKVFPAYQAKNRLSLQVKKQPGPLGFQKNALLVFIFCAGTSQLFITGNFWVSLTHSQWSDRLGEISMMLSAIAAVCLFYSILQGYRWETQTAQWQAEEPSENTVNHQDSTAVSNTSISLSDRDELEKQIQQRTAKVVRANRLLKQEIGKRKIAQKALRESETRLRLALNAASMAAWDWDIDTNQLSWSEGAESIFNLSHDQLNGSYEVFLNCIYPDDRSLLEQAIARSLARRTHYEIEARILWPDHSIHWIASKGDVVRDRTGKPIRMTGTVMDITQRKQAEEAETRLIASLQDAYDQLEHRVEERTAQLQTMNEQLLREVAERKEAEAALAESEAKFRSLILHSSDIISVLEADGMVRYQSPAVQRILGFSPEELIGKNIFEFVHPDDLVKVSRIFENLLQHPETVVSVQYRFQRQDGSWCWLEATGSNLLANPAIQGVVVNSRDVTERKQAMYELRQSEAQKTQLIASLQQQATQLQETLSELQQTQTQLIQTEKMSSLGQLVAGVAHEINNPVNFIHGNLIHTNHYIQDMLGLLQLYQQHYPEPVPEIEEYAETIEIDFLIEDVAKMLNSMQVGSDRIREIVLSLRNFSRLDESEMKPVDIHQGIENTLMILQHRFKDTGEHPPIHIIKEFAKLPLVQCYAGQLNQVFMNILVNAIDAVEETTKNWQTPKSYLPTIRISTAVNSDRITIGIADNGPGIPELVQQRLFDPFFTTKPVGKGTGLGLAISYQIVVEKHQGTLRCISSPGSGTEFVIEIPIQQRPCYSLIHGTKKQPQKTLELELCQSAKKVPN